MIYLEPPEHLKKQVKKKGGMGAIACSIPKEDEIDQQSRVYHALSDPIRLKIIALLAKQPLCVCLMKEVIPIPDSKISYHLCILKEAGLIEGKQEANWIIYNLTPDGRRFRPKRKMEQ